MSKIEEKEEILLCPKDLEKLIVIPHKFHEVDVYMCEICGAEYWDKDEVIIKKRSKEQIENNEHIKENKRIIKKGE